MTAFWVGAALLGAVAVGFLLFPLWQRRRHTGRWSVSGLLAAALAVPIAVALYFGVTTWQPEVLEQRAQETRLVTQLAERMARQPEDVAGWRLLGRSYVALGDYAKAEDAFLEAWERTPVPDSDLKLALAEAQVLADRASLAGEAGRLVEEVLATEPGNPKALWYGSQRALGLGQEAVARTRLTRLLGLGPPEQIAQIIRMQLAQLPSAEGGEEAASSADGPAIRLSVRLGEGISAADLSPQAMLFIFARDPAGGPPIAAIRQPASAVPGEFVLTDADAMLPGRSLGDFSELNLVARISESGQALEQSGDLYAERPFRPGEDGAVELVIDQVVQ